MALEWLLTGAASLVSGLLGRSSEKKRDRENRKAAEAANTRNEARVTSMNADLRARAAAAASVPIVTNSQSSGSVDVKAMMAGAEAAGFNPVTWLRNGGMQAYAETSSSEQVWNSRLMDAALAGSSIFQEGSPPLATARGVGEVIGSALQTGASQWVASAQQERQNQFQMGLLSMQLEGANKSGKGSGYSGYVPSAYLGGSHATGKGSAVLSVENAWKQVLDNNPNSKTFGKKIWVINPDVIGDPETLLTIPISEVVGGKPVDPYTGGPTLSEQVQGAQRSVEEFFRTWTWQRSSVAPKTVVPVKILGQPGVWLPELKRAK